MTEKQINESIKNAIEQTTPDILAQLEQELGLDRPQTEMEKRAAAIKPVRKRGRYYKRLAGIAAALVLFIGGYAMFDRDLQVCAIVGLDVNPSVEFSVDKNDRVLSAAAFNQDGEDVLRDLDFEGSDISVAGNAVVGVMLTKGYLTDTSNSILVSVRGDDETKSRAIEEKLSADLNGYLENAQISAAVLGQYVEEDEELAMFSQTNEISEGKAWLIRNLRRLDDRLTEDSLLKLSTQELILLGQEKGVFRDASYGTADKSQYISEDEALAIAAGQAGIDLSGAGDQGQVLDRYTVEFDCDDGKIVYEVDLISGGVEYEYEIDAVSGEVVTQETDLDDDRDDADDADDDRDDDDDDDDDDRHDDDDDDDEDDDDDGDNDDDDD